MKIVLVGYSGSQKIVPISKYLTTKYLPKWEFDVIYLNHRGDVRQWTKEMAIFLSYLTDEYIIFALDDYLMADHVDMKIYSAALRELGGDVVGIKLCENTEDELKEYPITTQYTIWNREYLISLLNAPYIDTPWEFEMECSRYFDKTILLRTCFYYPTSSSISSRWEGVRLDGLKEEDIKYIKDHGLI